jgi:hypothetical protein
MRIKKQTPCANGFALENFTAYQAYCRLLPDYFPSSKSVAGNQNFALHHEAPAGNLSAPFRRKLG